MLLFMPFAIILFPVLARPTHELSAWPLFILHAYNGTDPDTEH